MCRTDLDLAEGGLAAPEYPPITGHQVVGRVEALGAEVSGDCPKKTMPEEVSDGDS